MEHYSSKKGEKRVKAYRCLFVVYILNVRMPALVMVNICDAAN